MEHANLAYPAGLSGCEELCLADSTCTSFDMTFGENGPCCLHHRPFLFENATIWDGACYVKNDGEPDMRPAPTILRTNEPFSVRINNVRLPTAAGRTMWNF